MMTRQQIDERLAAIQERLSPDEQTFFGTTRAAMDGKQLAAVLVLPVDRAVAELRFAKLRAEGAKTIEFSEPITTRREH
jgi:hypothetical protein